MGKLVEGKWIKGSIVRSDDSGAYDRMARTFRNYISEDNKIFKPESGRYHLYVSHACPWANRTLIYRNLKKLQKHITYSVVHPDMLDYGWFFDSKFEGSTDDHIFGSKYLKDIYIKADPKITTSVTVPVLWDKNTNTIVNNESSEIIRMFNASFNNLTKDYKDFYPKSKKNLIDKLNEKIYHNINNGVYKAGFAKTQKAYDEAVDKLFSTLDELDSILSRNIYLTGDTITEADLRLIPTLLRFDAVYYTHFKCNKKRIKDYPNLSKYTYHLYEIDGIKKTTNFNHIKRHYFYSHEFINPYRIIPAGPSVIF